MKRLQHRKMVDKEADFPELQSITFYTLLGCRKMWRLDFQCHDSNLSYEKVINVTAVSRGLEEHRAFSCYILPTERKKNRWGEWKWNLGNKPSWTTAGQDCIVTGADQNASSLFSALMHPTSPCLKELSDSWTSHGRTTGQVLSCFTWYCAHTQLFLNTRALLPGMVTGKMCTVVNLHCWNPGSWAF